jgi:hypothetical protein
MEAADKTVESYIMARNQKPSRFKVTLDGLIKLVSLAQKLKTLWDLFH